MFFPFFNMLKLFVLLLLSYFLSLERVQHSIFLVFHAALSVFRRFLYIICTFPNITLTHRNDLETALALEVT